MKRKNWHYEDFITYENLQFTYQKIRKGCKNKSQVMAFEEHYTSNISHIYDLLMSKRYQVGKYHLFLIYEPKLRLIMSQDIGDKVINHFVAYFYLIPLLEPSMIDSNVAVRVGKGTSYGIHLLKRYLNERKEEEYYILKCDIRKYFYSIDHTILKEMIRKKIKDADILTLIDRIIDSTDLSYINETIEKFSRAVPLYQKGKGLPIGNMTSQILAIYYLNGLDHYIKENLKIRHYIRYMDDFILIHHDKKYLWECLNKIKEYLSRLQLECNEKTVLVSSKSGFSFLGYHFKTQKGKVVIQVTNRNKRKIKRRIHLYQNGKQTYLDMVCYQGYYKYCTKKIKFHRIKKLHRLM